MKGKYIPPGGYRCRSGRVLSAKEVTKAVRRYARKHGWYQRSVRSLSFLRFKAMEEYDHATTH